MAYQTSGGNLATYLDSSGTVDSTSYDMDPASSPAIGQSGGTVYLAFSSNSDQLYTGNGITEDPAGVVLYSGTSPAVAAIVTSSGTEWETALQVDTTDLWDVGQAADYGTGQGMAAGTSPAIVGLGSDNGAFDVAFQANTGHLFIGGGGADGLDTTEAMAPRTSPSLIAVGTSGVVIAFQGANGDLWICGADGTMDTGHDLHPPARRRRQPQGERALRMSAGSR